MTAAGALVELTAECDGATPCDGQYHFDMLPADPLTAWFDEGVSRCADEIGNFENRPIHAYRPPPAGFVQVGLGEVAPAVTPAH
jgi:hypothetical protein